VRREFLSAARLVAIARQGGSPHCERAVIDAILSGQDPTVAAETEALLATLEVLVRQHQRPAINPAITVVTTDRQGERPATGQEDAR
jgi:hypothetical protein